MEKKIVIAISGPPGAGSSSIAKEVAKRLDLEYFSPGKIFKSYFKGAEAKAALSGWKTKVGKSKELHKKLDDLQIEIAKRGNVVICGKLSIHFLKNLADYKIWVDAPPETRAERTAERDGISFKRALDQIIKRERLERNEFKRIYGFDYADLKKSADFILNNSKLSLKEAVGEILEFISQKT